MSDSRLRRSELTRSRSLGLRTNETASMSIPLSTAKSTQAASDAPVSGRSASAPGRFTPWWELTAPPASTSASISPPETSATRSRTRPSAR